MLLRNFQRGPLFEGGGGGAGSGRGASAEELEGPIPGQCDGGELSLHFLQVYFKSNLHNTHT